MGKGQQEHGWRSCFLGGTRKGLQVEDRILLRSGNSTVFLGRPANPGQPSTEVWSPSGIGVCAFSCLREEGLEEDAGQESWVPWVAASCQGNPGCQLQVQGLPPALGRDLLFIWLGESQGTLQKLLHCGIQAQATVVKNRRGRENLGRDWWRK